MSRSLIRTSQIVIAELTLKCKDVTSASIRQRLREKSLKCTVRVSIFLMAYNYIVLKM